MKFDLSAISVLLATLAPPLALFLAIAWDRHQRKHREKPPQSEKLLRPPGYSLSLRLENTADKIMNLILAAMMASAISGVAAFTFAGSMGVNAPFAHFTIPLLIAALFIGISLRAS